MIDPKRLKSSWRIGVDVGGTFTDLMVLDERSGAVHVLKTPTTPADPSDGLLAGIAAAAERFGLEPEEVGFILHGTTIATNAVLERKLPRGALIANRGFSDVLEIGRHVRREPYTLKPAPQTVLIPRDRRYGVEGRIRWDGSEETPLDEAGIGRIGAELAGVDAVAVAFLHAYRNPAHERRAAEILAEAAPGVSIALSSEVSPEIREFERVSTTVLNALLVPAVRAYLERLVARLRNAGLEARLYLVQSNGGVTTSARAARLPVRLLLSGPSGGAMAAAELARTLRQPNLVAVDMGGTSFDVSVVRGGESTVVTEGEIDGLPVRLPMVEMRTIGAGGGSIAEAAPGRALSVGPRSAGADPGPAAYGKGGVEPTVTDANVVLGRLDPGFFLGGAVQLDAARARAAVAERIAAPLGLGVEEAADGILAVVNAHMASAIKLSLFEKGADPRDFAIAAFGGAGGLHAVSLAEELEMRQVIFPRNPGTFSARGILTADIAHDVARSPPARRRRHRIAGFGGAGGGTVCGGPRPARRRRHRRGCAQCSSRRRHALSGAGVRIAGALGRSAARRAVAGASGRRFPHPASGALCAFRQQRAGRDRDLARDRPGIASQAAHQSAVSGGGGAERQAARLDGRRLAAPAHL